MVIFSLSPLRATTIAIAIVGRAITLEGEPSTMKQRTDTKKNANKIKSDNSTRSNREKSNIAIAILEIWMIDGTIIILYFSGSNNIFADCIWIVYSYLIRNYAFVKSIVSYFLLAFVQLQNNHFELTTHTHIDIVYWKTNFRVISCEITHSKNETLSIVFKLSTQNVHPMKFLNLEYQPPVTSGSIVTGYTISENRQTSIKHNL